MNRSLVSSPLPWKNVCRRPWSVRLIEKRYNFTNYYFSTRVLHELFPGVLRSSTIDFYFNENLFFIVS